MPSPGREMLLGVVGLCFLVLLAAASVLAIIGLVEIRKCPGSYTQGRAQAVWSLALVGFFGALLVINIGVSFARGRMNGRNLLTQSPAGKMLTNEELNFRFRSPERPWVPFPAAKLNKECNLAFTRRNPQVYFMIIAEALGAQNSISSEQLAELGKAHLESAAQSSRIIKEATFSRNGLNGLWVETDAQVGTLSLYYQHWFIVTNGFAYQLIGYGRQADRLRVSEELKAIFTRFELLDSTRIASAGGKTFPTNFISARYDYSVQVTNSPWHVYPNLDKQFSNAEFGASRGDSCLIVVPVALGAENPSLEALSYAFLGMMSIKYPNEELKNRQSYQPDGLEGVRYDYEREIDQVRFRYRFGILRGGDKAWLIAAWTQRRPTEAGQILSDAFARVKFETRSLRLLSDTPPFRARELERHGLVLNQSGLFEYRAGEYESALRLFRAAAREVPGERLYVANALQTWSSVERPREALEFLESQDASLRQHPEFRAWQAYFQAEASLSDQALTNYQALFASDYVDEKHFARYVNLLNEQRRFPEALDAIGKYLQREDSVRVRLLEAQTHRLKGDFPAAIKVLRQQREKAPGNSQVAAALAETCLQDGAPNEALEVARDMVKQNPNSAYALFLRGKSELALKWYRDARTSFEAAARLEPADKTLQSYLDHVSGLLGEGNNQYVREPIEAVALPEAWTNCAFEAAPADFAGKYGAYYARLIEAVRWEPGQEHKISESFEVHLLDASGVGAFSTLQRSFDPLAEQLFVNELRVLDETGKTLSTGKVEDYYVLDEQSANSATHRKVLNIPVPGLRPGCRLQVTITRRELGKLQDFPFFEHCFSRGFPVRESLVLLQGKTAGVQYRSVPAREPEKLTEGLCWRLRNPVVVRLEPLQCPVQRFAPMLWIGDGAARWAGIVTNYLASVADRLQADDQLLEVVKGIVSGVGERDAKIAALSAYVQTNFTYKAIEFGRRAQIPNRPGEILRNRYGDCKDQALLLQQMLAVAGVPAQLALVNTRAPVEKDLPSLDQFDHMVVFVPGGGLFVDPTDKGYNPLCGSPGNLVGCDALILDAREPRFRVIPAPAEKDCVIEIQRRVRIVDAENMAAEEKISLSGLPGAYLRNFLKEIPANSRQMIFQQQMGLAEVELLEFRAEPLEVPGAPLEVSCRYTARKQFRREANRITGALRAFVERIYLAPAPVDRRSSPFELRSPLVLKSTMILEIPDGYHAESPAQIIPKVEPRFGSCTQTCSLEENRMRLVFQLRKPAGTFNAEDYAAFRESMTQALTAVERNVTLTLLPGKG